MKTAYGYFVNNTRMSAKLFAALTWLAAGGLQAQPGVIGQWQPQGPAPALDGQVENVAPNNEVVGAVHVVLPHPTDANILYIGTVNGGVWKTANATASSPNWTRLTDDFPSLSIGALAFDSADPSRQTIYAGIGQFSSLNIGGDRIGLLKSTDGGQNWSVIDGGGTLVNKNVSGLAVNGNNIVVSVNFAVPFNFGEVGIFRSTNGGQNFTLLTDGDGSSTPLPGGVSNDLVRDPSNPTRLFTSVAFANQVGGQNGLYRSDNFGASWSRVSNPVIESLFTDAAGNNLISNIEFAVGNSNNVFVALVQSENIQTGRLGAVLHSNNGGGNWFFMDLPATIEDGFFVGLHPGNQGRNHMSIAADPTNPNIVYIGGDRQPSFGEVSGGPGVFPNSIGANDFSGRLFRGDAFQPSGFQWFPLTHSFGTASNSSPHADSRDMAFTADGVLIEADDGGIYRRTQPRSTAGDWFSINGDLASTEYHGIAYDAVSDIILGGAQDTGTTEQISSDSSIFFSVSTADGGDPAIDDNTSTNQSTRYTSNQFLGGFRRRIVNASNNVQSAVQPALNVVGGGAALQPQFYTPVVVNASDGDRLLLGAANSLYESLDRGDTISEIAPGQRVNALVGDPLIYGVPGNANLIYAAVTFDAGGGKLVQALLRRTAAPPAALTAVTLPAGNNTIIDLAVDPDVTGSLFALTSSQVFRSTDSGSSWSEITGNLGSQDTGQLRSLAFVPDTDLDALVVGSNRGTFVAADSDSFSTWGRLGNNLPNAPVFELEYDNQADALIAGLLGRGAWKLQPVMFDADLLFIDSFE